MESTVEEIGPCRKKITITVPADQIKDEIEKSYQELISNIQLPGFRRGRVPRGLLEKRYGSDIRADVKQNIVTNSFQDAISENSFNPIGEPEIDFEGIQIDPKADLTFEVTIEVKPEIELDGYKGLKIKMPSSAITDEELEESISTLAQRNAELSPVDGKSEKEHVLVGDVALKQDDNVIEQRDDVQIQPEQGHILGVPCPSLPDALVGVGAGEVHELELDLRQGEDREAESETETEGEERPRTTAVFTVKEVKRVDVPEINDEWAKRHDFDDLAALNEHVRKTLEQRKAKQIESALEEALVEDLLKRTPFETPEGIVEQELEKAAGKYRIRLQVEGLEDEMELDSKVAEYRNKAKSEVVKDFQKAFLLDKLATIEKIYVTEDEVAEQLIAIAAHHKKTPEEVRDYYESRNLLPDLRSQIREAKARRFLRENAEIEEETPEEQ